MQCKIIRQLELFCRITDVTIRQNDGDNSEFVVYKLCDYSDRFICSHTERINAYNRLLNDWKTQKKYTVIRSVIQFQEKMCHRFSWDDFERKLCTWEQCGKIQKDKEGKPIEVNHAIIYTNINNKVRPTINEILNRDYIEVNSPLLRFYD